MTTLDAILDANKQISCYKGKSAKNLTQTLDVSILQLVLVLSNKKGIVDKAAC